MKAHWVTSSRRDTLCGLVVPTYPKAPLKIAEVLRHVDCEDCREAIRKDIQCWDDR